jgi:hypothetical protein
MNFSEGFSWHVEAAKTGLINVSAGFTDGLTLITESARRARKAPSFFNPQKKWFEICKRKLPAAEKDRITGKVQDLVALLRRNRMTFSAAGSRND